jgi:hypothetical protein
MISFNINNLTFLVSQEGEHEQPKTQTLDVRHQEHYNVDKDALSAIFDEYDTDHKGTITLDELEVMLTKLGVAPFKDVSKIPSASGAC